MKEYRTLCEPVKNEPIVTICNNKVVNWNQREDAKQFFFNKYHNLPISEREPYGNVLVWILLGKKVCTDKG